MPIPLRRHVVSGRYVMFIVGIFFAVSLAWVISTHGYEPLLVLGVLSAIGVVASVLVYPAAAAPCVLFLVPFSGVSAGTSGALVRFATPAIVLLWLARILPSERRLDILRLDRSDVFVLIFCGLSSFSVLLLDPTDHSLVGTYAALFGLYILVSRSTESPEQARRALLGLCLGLMLAAAIALFLRGAAPELIYGGPSGQIVRLGQVGESGSQFAGVNSFGGEMIVAIVIPWIAFRKGRPPWTLWLLRMGSIVPLAALINTVSRAATIGLGVALVIWLMLSTDLSRAKRLAVAIALSLGAVLLTPSSIRYRFQQIHLPGAGQTEATARLVIWQAGLRMFEAHPLFGIGVGNFPLELPRYLPASISVPQQDAHSIFVAALAEMGIVGIVALLAMVFEMWVRPLTGALMRRRLVYPLTTLGGPAWTPLVVALIVAMSGYLVVAATVDLSRDRMFFALLALSHALYVGWRCEVRGQSLGALL